MKTLTDRDVIMYWAEVFAKDLNIPIPKITVYKNRWKTSFRHSKYAISINLKQIQEYRSCMILCLAHEMRHAYQSHNGLLIPGTKNSRAMIWQNKSTPDTWKTIKQYQALPWEADSIKYEKKIAKKYKLKMRKLA